MLYMYVAYACIHVHFFIANMFIFNVQIHVLYIHDVSFTLCALHGRMLMYFLSIVLFYPVKDVLKAITLTIGTDSEGCGPSHDIDVFHYSVKPRLSGPAYQYSSISIPIGLNSI